MQEQDIPIDINSGKLLEWLINRRHCTRDWQANIIAIREKINNAIQDMPVHEGIAQLLSGTYINYFHCKKIIEILKETEVDSKNLFGRYGSKRMKDWQEIVRLYEKDNMYLAEAAQMLMRNINFEVPSFKKQIQKLEQTQNDLEKKETEYKKSENIARTEFSTLCKQLGIPGQKIKKELVERVSELPEIYNRLVEKAKSIDNVVEFYSSFVEFTLGRQHDGGCVPMVKYVIDKGNTTTYEWTYGEAPLSVVETALNVNFDDDEEEEAKEHGEIDFGNEPKEEIDFGQLDGEGEIDFGARGDIDWGNIESVDGTAEEIDFNISLEESGIVVEAAGLDGGIATGTEALTVLDNPSTRNDFIDQLLELESFLKLRLYEFQGDNRNNVLSMSQMQQASPILQLATPDSTKSMLDHVQVLITEVLDSRVQHLHNIKHSPRYVDLLAASLRQKLKMAEKMVSLQKLTSQRREDIINQALALQPMLKMVIRRTKELQTEIEQDISKKYKNRIVHLTGGVNNLQ
ncbi:CDK5 regulatory subunit-associated protein 3 [Neodiprion pinetum]|uniref:CDK5 regulatory subunit-associated protein 3 n=1 Tax=Neodiprion pinetum TaxID=441929 RepID=UPI001EDCB456|nr:CDK5 regulatory subunit-associated protein 3 [Neodiprion pinetum]